MTQTAETAKSWRCPDGSACDHCGALVFAETTKCPQCRRFPIKLHRCPRCRSIAARDATQCWKCQRVFAPDGDYL